MTWAVDPNALFSRAERYFTAGKLFEARTDLIALSRVAGDHPAVSHLLALVEARRGDRTAARRAFEAARLAAPGDPQIANNYGNFLADGGEWNAALDTYRGALSAKADFTEARLNMAMLLEKLQRDEEALAQFNLVLNERPHDAKAWSARGALLRKLGRLEEAAISFDKALTVEPQRATALYGRARVALERGESDASVRYRTALEHRPDDPELLIGYAEALELEGDPRGVEILGEAVKTAPSWIEGQTVLARMRWEAGEGAAFARGFRRALQQSPEDGALWKAYVQALAAAKLTAEAAEAATAGRLARGGDHDLALVEAMLRSELDELETADAILASLPDAVPGRLRVLARHLIRKGRYEEALPVVEQARAGDAWDVELWALTGLLWRLLDHPRTCWLLGGDSLFGPRELDLGPKEIRVIADTLRGLHKTKAHPIGQSLRGGTQTRGRMFARGEPEIKRLRQAIEAALSDYWNSLPPPDAEHPLLRHRAARPRIEGSWSVRLTNGGFHVSHIHPHGHLSSACYLVVPENSGTGDGDLEIGGPPAALAVPVKPLMSITPQPGRLALFPSYLYHGTRPFASGERLTVAFDVVAR